MATIDEKRKKLLDLDNELKKLGISRKSLQEAEGWSATTCYRKMSGESDWLISEINILIKIGVDLTTIIDLFLTADK